VVPYYGYARQDRKDRPRVAISAKLVADLLDTAGLTALFVDLHAAQIQASSIFRWITCSRAGTVSHFRSLALPNLIVVSPDAAAWSGPATLRRRWGAAGHRG